MALCRCIGLLIDGRIAETYGLNGDGRALGDGKYKYEYDAEGAPIEFGHSMTLCLTARLISSPYMNTRLMKLETGSSVGSSTNRVAIQLGRRKLPPES
jgi:hypothetical protein